MAAGHSLLIWYYALSLDSAFLRAGLDPRISLLPERYVAALTPVDVTRTIAGCGVALAALCLLLVGEPRLSLLVAAAGVGISLFVRTATKSGDRRRFLLAEWVWAGVMLMGPCLLVAAPGWSAHGQATGAQSSPLPPAGMSSAVVAATALGALMLGAWVLLCLRRDEAPDRDAGLVTTATALGKGGVLVIIAIWTLGAMTLAVWGVSLDWWDWPVAALVGWAVALLAWLSASGADRAGVVVWAAAQALVALALLRDRGAP